MSMCMRSRKDKEKTSDLEEQKRVVREALKIMYDHKYLLCPPIEYCFPSCDKCYDCWLKWANKE